MDLVRNAFSKAGADLKHALDVAWPGGNGRMIHEKNATTQFAFRLQERGFVTFFEPALVRSKSRSRQSLESLDLLALHPEQGIVLVAESKSLYATKYIDGLTNDVYRMGKYLTSYKHERHDYSEFTIRTRVAVSLAITDQKRFKDWWVDEAPLVKSPTDTMTSFHRALKMRKAEICSPELLLDQAESENADEWSLLGAFWNVGS